MTTKYSRQEILTNVFLAQLAYSICCGIVLLAINRGYANTATITSMPTVMIVLTIASAVFAGGYLLVWLNIPAERRKSKYRDFFLYGIGFSLGCLYLQTFHRIPAMYEALFKAERPGWMSGIFTLQHAMTSMYYIIGIYMIIVFVAYIIRYNQKPGGKNGHNKRKKRG